MSDDEGGRDAPPQMRALGRVTVRLEPPRRAGLWSMRIDTFFNSGMAVLEQLLSLRGRLLALSALQGDLNEMLLEHVMHLSLVEQQPTGPPPIADKDFGNLVQVDVTPFHLRQEANQSCCVCQDAFTVGTRVTQLPCGHIYCPGCIEEWLKLHRSCPMCRKEVKDVPEAVWGFDQCGFEQLRQKECFAMSKSLVVLPRCSHAFHRACLRRHLRCRMHEEGDTFALDCPLCKAPSVVARADLSSGLSPASTAPLQPLPPEPPDRPPPCSEDEDDTNPGVLRVSSARSLLQASQRPKASCIASETAGSMAAHGRRSRRPPSTRSKPSA